MLWILALILASLATLYDLQTRRIPNWFTIPLLVSGLVLNFPGSGEIWLLMMILFLAFANNWMGAGDVKLWMALVWLMPLTASAPVLFTALMTLLITGLAQIIWRWMRKRPVTGIASPAAWRTIPFVIALWYVH